MQKGRKNAALFSISITAKLFQAQYRSIEDCLPHQRGNISTNFQALNAVLYVAEYGCTWRSLCKCFGRWHTMTHMFAADAQTTKAFSLSQGQAHDAPEGRKLLRKLGPLTSPIRLLLVGSMSLTPPAIRPWT